MSGMNHSPEYKAHIKSDRWRAICARIHRRANGCCENPKCGQATWALEVHHLTYDRLGHERDEDLQALCPACHKKADRKRAEDVASRRWGRRVDGWARKVYGDDWEDRLDWSYVEGQFEDWLERRDWRDAA